MRILSAHKKDIAKIYSIMKKEGKTAYTKDLVADLASSKGSLLIKAVEDNNIIAALGARAEGKNSAWLYFIVVDKKHRNRGIAKALNEELHKRCKAKGIKRIALDTPECPVFLKLGYKQIGKIPKWYETKDQIIMFKKL